MAGPPSRLENYFSDGRMLSKPDGLFPTVFPTVKDNIRVKLGELREEVKGLIFLFQGVLGKAGISR
jgi:hypothetical protein